MPEANRIDTLELMITSDADKATKALDALATTLKNVKTAMGGFKTTEFSQVTDNAFKMAKAFSDAFAPLRKLTKETSKLKTVKVGLDAEAIEKGIDELRGKFKDVGMDFQFTGNLDEAEKTISAIASQLDKLFAKEKRAIATGANINTGGFRGLEYDISLLTNKLDILRDKREELQKAFAKGFENLPIQQMKYDAAGAGEEKPRISNIFPESLNFNPEAMKAVFGEMAGNIKNWNDAVSQLGGNASRILNDMQQDFQDVGGGASGLSEKMAAAGEKIKDGLKSAGLSAEEFEKALENLKTPEIDETNLKKLQSQLARTEQKIKDLTTKQENNVRLGIDVDSQPMRNLSRQIVEASNRADALKSKIQEVEAAAKPTPWQKLKSIISAIIGNIGKMKTAVKGVFSWVGKIKKGFSGMTGIVKKIGSGFSGMLGKIGKVAKAITGIGKEKKGGGFNLGKMFQMSAIYSAISSVISGIKNAVAEGSQNLAQYSSGYNQSISSVMSALTQLKNAFTVAFAPIVNVVAPYLSTFISMLSAAANKVGQFFAALTGQSFSAQAIPVVQDYAAGLQDTSKNMDDTAGSAKKLKKALSVLSFDELNQLTAHDDDSETGTGGTGGASGGELSPADMFDTVPVESKIKEFADKIKEAWKTADFTEIGSIVGEKLNTALSKIPWGSIKKTCNKIAKSVATFLNGFIETTDWGLVGGTISEGINTAFEMANTFATNFHWSSLGKAVGDGINGALNKLNWQLIRATISNITKGITDFLNKAIETADFRLIGFSFGQGVNTIIDAGYTFVTNFKWGDFGKKISQGINGALQTIDFAKAGQTLSGFVKGALSTLIETVEGTDWGLFGEKVKEFLINIDWPGIFDKLSEAIGAAFGGLAAFLGGLLSDGVSSAKDFFDERIEECGGNIVLGILKGIGDAIVGIAEWIKEHIFQPFIDGFKKVFGINSPSTVMAEQGGYIISGLLQGLKDTIGSVLEWVSGIPGWIIDKLGDAGSWLVQKGKDAIAGLKNGWEAVKESEFGKTVSQIGSYAFSKAGDALNWIRQKGSDAVQGLKNGWEAVKESSIGKAVSAIGNFVKEKAGDATAWLNEKGKNAIQGLKNGWDSIKENGFLNSVAKIGGEVFSSIGDIKDKVMSKGSDIVSGLKNGLTGNWNTLSSWLGNLPSKISNAIPNLFNTGKNAIQNFINGFGSLHIPLPHISVSWNSHTVGPLSFSTPSFGVSWYKDGGVIMNPYIFGMSNGRLLGGGEGGKEAMLPLDNKRAMSMVANGIMSNVDGGFGLTKEELRQAVAEGVVMAFMNNQFGNNNTQPINITVKLENDEAIARAAIRGQQKIDYRMNPTPRFAY